MIHVELSMPRSAFSPREAARAGDVWRLFQEVAVEGSTKAGWPPARYRENGVSFVMRAMTTVHHREAVYGEPIHGTTWPSRVQRELFFRRECRVSTPRGPLASTTQEWVHVKEPLELAPASQELLAAFAIETHDGPIALPASRPVESTRTYEFGFECWHTWMDPLAHVNHPAYVDFADEALCRVLSARGIDPRMLVPIAEEARFSNGLVAGDRATVVTRLIGETEDGSAVFEHRVRSGERNAAKLVTVRRLFGEVGRSLLLETA